MMLFGPQQHTYEATKQLRTHNGKEIYILSDAIPFAINIYFPWLLGFVLHDTNLRCALLSDTNLFPSHRPRLIC